MKRPEYEYRRLLVKPPMPVVKDDIVSESRPATENEMWAQLAAEYNKLGADGWEIFHVIETKSDWPVLWCRRERKPGLYRN